MKLTSSASPKPTQTMAQLFMVKRLVVFVHGLGSNTKDAWQDFPRLLTADASVMQHCQEVTDFEYPTSLTGATIPLAEIAPSLAGFIAQKNLNNAFNEIAFIAHSQGGLLVRRYLCDLFRGQVQSHPLFSLLTFATPHWGAYSEKASWFMSDKQHQIKELAYDSASIAAVNQDWVSTDAEDRVRMLRVVGADDAIVPQFSAMGANYAHDYRIVPGHGHGSLVKVLAPDHPSFTIAKEFLTTPAPHHPALVNPDKTPPVLSAHWQEGRAVVGASRFVYTSRYTDFTGRDAEIAHINQFIHSPAEGNIAWMWVKGEGGVGKSRLALEFCLAWHSDWHAGFLNRDADAPDWARWQPRLPTLMVLDYATGDTEQLGKLLRGLCNRDAAHSLRRPVRLLLLDRNQKDDDLQRAIGTGAAAHGIQRCRASDLNLQSITEPWAIIHNFLANSGKPLPDKTQTLTALTHIDPLNRPLFAMLVAESLAEGMPLGSLNRETLLGTVISRERGQYWQPAAQKNGVTLPTAERLLAFATMVGGLSLQTISSLAATSPSVVPLLEPWNADTYTPVFQAMAGYDSASDTIAPLAPDLLGECFVLRQLQEIGPVKAQTLINHAWNNWPSQVFSFFDRVAQDYAQDDSLQHAVEVQLGNPLTQLAWPAWIVNFIGITAKQFPHRAIKAYQHLANLAKVHPQSSEIQFTLAQAAFNLISHITVTNPAIAKSIFAELQTLAKGYPKSGEIQLRVANAAFNLINDIATTEPDVAKSVFAELQALAKENPQPEEIQCRVAQAAVNLISHITATEPAMAKSVFSDLQTLAKENPKSGEIQLRIAQAAVNLINDITATEPAVAKSVFSNLQTLAEENPKSGEIQLEFAKASLNLIYGITAADPRVAKSAFYDLEKLSNEYSKNKQIEEIFLSVANFMVLQLRDLDPAWVQGTLEKHGDAIMGFMQKQ
jgi:Putative serine esterase (DUF676)